jgi:plastocyanin
MIEMKMIFLCMFFSTGVYAKEVEVKMKSLSFDPKSVTISVGDSVKWENTAYTDHSASGEGFDTGLVPPKGESKPIVFSKAGTYPYNCKIHGKTMSGTVVVGAK